MSVKTKIAKEISISCLTVSDLSKAKHLFVNILGLNIKDNQEEYNWIEIGGEDGHTIGIGEEEQQGEWSNFKAGSNAIVSIEVYNLERAIQHLEKHQVKICGDIIEIPHQVKMILFEDLDGNKFWLTQTLSQAVENPMTAT